MYKLRVPSSVPAGTEQVVTRVIGCAVEVHRTLGPGLLEKIYARAMHVELSERHIPFEVEKSVVVKFKGEVLAVQRIDLVIAEQVVVEVKAVRRLEAVHEAQLLCYLRLTGIRVGLLMNFNVPVIGQGLRRLVL